MTIRLSTEVIDHFKRMAQAKGLPYESLIDLYLRDCAARGRELELTWK